MLKRALTAAGILAGAAFVAIGLTAATVPPAAADQAPECVTVVVLGLQPDGTVGSRAHLEFCGGSPGADSALHDWAQGHRFVLDGAAAIGDGCGGWADPCVIFPR